MDRLSALFGHQVEFSYTALDRIVLNAYIERLQRPENLVYFFHDIAGVPCIDPKALSRRTDRYRAWVRRFSDEEWIPLFAAPKGARKEDVVLPYYQRLRGRPGIACILTSMEQGSTFVSYTPRFATDDPNYRRISRCRKRFLHYYFYVFDEVAGPMSLRVASYLPFNLTFYLNGHSFIVRELNRRRVPFHQEDNALLAVGSLKALREAAVHVTPELLRERCNYWARQLAPTFSSAERAVFDTSYRYSIAQVEVATDVVFKRSAALKARFARLAELGILLGGADWTTQLFGRRITRRFGGRLQTTLDRRNEGQPVLRYYYHSSFVRQYQRNDRLLRNETCINSTYHLGIRRRLENLPTVVQRATGINKRLLDAQAELLDSTVDAGELSALAQPTFIGKRRVPGLKLEDDRTIRLLDAILHPGGFLADWTTKEVQKRICDRAKLQEGDYRLSQLRYDLSKLRAKGLVERIGNSRRYRVTERGLKLGTLWVNLRLRLFGPLASQLAAVPRERSNNPSAVEAALRNVDAALDTLCEALGLRAA